MPKFFRMDLSDSPSAVQERQAFSPIIRAIKTLSTVLDNFIAGSQVSAALTTTAIIPSNITVGSLVFVSDTGTVTDDLSEGANAVLISKTQVRYQSCVATGFTDLVQGKWYWLVLKTGEITNAPNTNSRLQLLGPATTTSDIHFTYSPPTS